MHTAKYLSKEFIIDILKIWITLCSYEGDDDGDLYTVNKIKKFLDTSVINGKSVANYRLLVRAECVHSPCAVQAEQTGLLCNDFFDFGSQPLKKAGKISISDFQTADSFARLGSKLLVGCPIRPSEVRATCRATFLVLIFLILSSLTLLLKSQKRKSQITPALELSSSPPVQCNQPAL